MPKFDKTSSDNNPAEKTSTSEKHVGLKSKGIAKAWKGSRKAIIIASAVIALILIIVVVSLYINGASLRHTIIIVDDTSINMDYFLRRMRLSGSDSMVMLEALTNEQLIKIEAPKYGAAASPEDITQELRRIASGESGTISDSEFEEWYRQILNDNDFSDSEYREMVATSLSAARLQEYLATKVSTVAEQVYLNIMSLGDGDMSKIMQKEQAGEDFSELITEIWLNGDPEEAVEDVGWIPRGVLPSGFDEVAFELAIGQVGGPVGYLSEESTESGEVSYYLLKVSEKADAREIDEEYLQILRIKTLDDWLLAEIKLHKVEWHGLHNGFDTETNYWINWQLSR